MTRKNGDRFFLPGAETDDDDDNDDDNDDDDEYDKNNANT